MHLEAIHIQGDYGCKVVVTYTQTHASRKQLAIILPPGGYTYSTMQGDYGVLCNRQARAAQYKLNVTSRKIAN